MTDQLITSQKLNYIPLTLASFILMFLNSYHFVSFMCDVQIYWVENMALVIFPVAVAVSAYLIKRKALKVAFIIASLICSFLFFPVLYGVAGLVAETC